jgi:hypothetical protein
MDFVMTILDFNFSVVFKKYSFKVSMKITSFLDGPLLGMGKPIPALTYNILMLI